MRWGGQGGTGEHLQGGVQRVPRRLSCGGALCYHSGIHGPPQLAESRSECSVPPHASHITVLVFPSFKRRVTQKRLRLVAEAALDAAAAR